jgi:lysophospholipase L1-like esterase
VSQQLAQVLSLLKNAAGPNVKFVGVGHYDPYLARYFDNAGGVADAKESLGVVRHLDRTLDDVYQSFSIPMANVGQAFNIDGTQSVAIEGLGTVPENVAEVCLLTWMCQPAPMGPNIHPNDAGYEAIAGSIEQVLTPW